MLNISRKFPKISKNVIYAHRYIWSLIPVHGLPCSATRENLNKTLVKNDNPKFSYRNNENYEIHHRLFSNKHVELVYTKYEVKRSIIKEDVCKQPFNPVFDMLTVDWL